MSKVVRKNKTKVRVSVGMSLEEKWAKERNFAKFRVTGFAVNLTNLANGVVLVPDEYREVKEVIEKLEKLLKTWDGRNDKSKMQYLRLQ